MTDKTELFALILPSDASPSLHPENTASSWQVHVALPHAIHLDPQKVCMCHCVMSLSLIIGPRSPVMRC